ncbi:MAG: type III secretion system chaperone [Bacillota bacterium]
MTTSLEVEMIFRQEGISYTFVAENRWLVAHQGHEIIIRHDEEGQWLTFVVAISPVPPSEPRGLFRFLLEANWEVPCGAFAIYPESDEIVFTDQIPTEDLDSVELLASLNSCAHIIERYAGRIRSLVREIS